MQLFNEEEGSQLQAHKVQVPVLPDDPPTDLVYFEDTHIIDYKIWKNEQNQYHRLNDLPALIGYNKNGNIEFEEYCINGQKHRDNDKPAKIRYYENGNIESKHYYINGQTHRDNDKPAIIYYNENGNIKEKGYLVNGQYHRDNDLPAVFWYTKDGSIIMRREYWVNGKRIK
jgi:antitoxin component YwqK of YwqJK toxin-antitoxin module